MRITLKQLSIFKAIHNCGQISKAAKELHLSVPAVSMALRDLEDSLGSRLFERSSTGLTINDNGAVILPYANEMLSKGMELEHVFAQGNNIRGSIKVGCSKTTGNYVLSRKIPLFKMQHPSVDIKLVINNSLCIEQMVAEKELDLGFVDAKPGLKNLSQEPWLKDRLCIVTGCNNPLVTEAITSEILSQQLWVMDETISVSRLRNTQLLKSANITITQELSMNTMGAIKRAIGTGFGVSVLPLLAVEEEIIRGELVELALNHWDYSRHYWAIYRNDEPLTRLTREFLDFSVPTPAQ
ncbi:LysR family transcriptional regulator [Shewanella litoralis]|uniref:LysR family transcriptional regulator n=1 Tax=Shewanella litoralis TaxID=2282700 RepID=A0ABQ2RA05_9GAMM|nr:LysR family transcriptional regulator [Shewanella litoralis]GGQ16033.1 LysR family transcriptional regulator [Shewanella litoralis]